MFWYLISEHVLELSSISLYEIMTLKACFKIVTRKEFQCSQCKDPKFPKEYLDKRRRVKGCFGSNRPVFQIDEFKFHTCIGNLWSNSFDIVMDMYNLYNKRGKLPFDGTILDQPAKILDIFKIMDSLRNEYEQEQEAKEKNNGK